MAKMFFVFAIMFCVILAIIEYLQSLNKRQRNWLILNMGQAFIITIVVSAIMLAIYQIF